MALDLDLDLDLDPCYDQLPPVAGGEAAAAKPLGGGLGGAGAPPGIRRSGYGCSAEGTDAAWRAPGSGALGSQPVRTSTWFGRKQKNQIASRFDFFC